LKALIFNIQKCSLHDGLGIRTNIFFKGCNLSCKWCSNPESQSFDVQTMNNEQVGKYYNIDELTAEVIKDKPFYDMSGGGITLSGGEPMLQHEFVSKLCDKLHFNDIHIAIETAACIGQNIFIKVIEKCDLGLIDLKHWDSNKHKTYVGMDNDLALSNIEYALKNLKIPIIIRIPIIPNFNASLLDAKEFAKLLASIGAKKAHLLPFHQMGEGKYEQLNMDYYYKDIKQLHDEDLIEYAKEFDKYNIDVQIGG